MDIAVYMVLPILMLFIGALSSVQERRIKRLDRRIKELDRKTDLILRHMGIAEPDGGPDLARVRALLIEGKQMKALAAYREITGADVKQAVEAINRM